MTETPHTNLLAEIPRLQALAEFRFRVRSFLSFSEIAAERVGIQAQQYQLMQVIAALPDGQQGSISHLAERMVLRHNSTVELVDRAERAGLVERYNDQKDLRRSLVRLTAQGETILRRLVQEHLEEISRMSPELFRSLEALQQPQP